MSLFGFTSVQIRQNAGGNGPASSSSKGKEKWHPVLKQPLTVIKTRNNHPQSYKMRSESEATSALN